MRVWNSTGSGTEKITVVSENDIPVIVHLGDGFILDCEHGNTGRLTDILKELRNGKHVSFNFPLPQATDYTRKVWQEIMSIPPGTSITYKELAARAGGSPRSAASACAKNKLALLIPCHRVIPSGNKGCGNYKWGKSIKAELLKREADFISSFP